MHPPSASSLLSIWEQGRRQLPVQRGLLLLVAACPHDAPETLATMSIGQRDTLLLRLRDLLFGPQLASVADCPQCGERLELSFAVSDIAVDAESSLAPEQGVKTGDYEVRFRLPNSLDLLVLAEQDGAWDPRQSLLERCVVGMMRDGQECALGDAPSEVLNAVVQRMAEVDAQADVQLQLTCPACTHTWLAAFDILSYLWSEIDAWAHRILQEVHVLASAYNWREADILALSPWRRQYYLSMIQ